MKFLSYNIYLGGVAPDPGRFDDVCQLLKREQPDVLALNECNGFELDGHRRLHLLETELGMRGFLALAPSGFHVAILVRGVDVVFHQAEPAGFHHAALQVQVTLHGRRVRFVSVHMCPFGGTTRLCEAELLTRFARPDVPTVIMGDLNALSPRDTQHYDVNQFNQRLLARHTLPSVSSGDSSRPGGSRPIDTRAVALLEAAGFVDLFRQHHTTGAYVSAPTELRSPPPGEQLRIDYVLASASLASRSRDCRIIDDALTRRASDHFPVVAEFDFA